MGVVEAFVTVSRDGAIAPPGQAVHAAGAGGTTTAFEVDRDRIPEIVADLGRAVDALAEAERAAREGDGFVPPGEDPVSAGAAWEMGPQLTGKYLARIAVVRAGLESMILNLRAAMAQHDAEEGRAPGSSGA
ncbi:hypothetical protein [Saccharopolyspora taberi]|uniref:PE family protein n=1 Tax=Saccharopolyspora taberi TaxID=60895 RepID=A0ABN3VBA1_9PSEU